MGAGQSIDEDKQYFWQTYFWLEFGRTGLGFARLKVFEDDTIKLLSPPSNAFLEAGGTISPRSRDDFPSRTPSNDEDDFTMEEPDLEMGNDIKKPKEDNKAEELYFPEPKKDLLPPIQSPEKDDKDLMPQPPPPGAVEEEFNSPKPLPPPPGSVDEEKIEEKADSDLDLEKSQNDSAKIKGKKTAAAISRAKKKKGNQKTKLNFEDSDTDEEDDIFAGHDDFKLIKRKHVIELGKKAAAARAVTLHRKRSSDKATAEAGTSSSVPISKLFPMIMVRKVGEFKKKVQGVKNNPDGTPNPNFSANRPSLKDLLALNIPGPDEMDGSGAFVSKHEEKDADKGKLLRSEKSLTRQLESRSVLVAVRMRPFNKRERGLNDTCCIDIPTATKMIVKSNPNKPEDKDRDFNFDCAFGWDATQVQVYKRTGRPLLIKALNGYNACLFAYGQTGSGKTYSMFGSEEDKGVVPLMLDELFDNVEAQKENGRIITVSMSMLEIYNERLHDLLVRSGTGNDKDLPVREDKYGGKGVFVDGLSEFMIENAKHALKLFDDAQTRRAVGRTNMNAHSSRSHAVITLRINVTGAPGFTDVLTTSSKLHLIDLAGSERQAKTGATGDQLKEGAAINLSLTALGNVINALTESTKGSDEGEGKLKSRKDKKPKTHFIPYRDSKLTRILQDSLGGNAVTCMLAAMSPADSNKEETISALRFAERAKKIENKVTKNINAKDVQLTNLTKANKAMQAMIDRLNRHIERLERFY